FVPFSFLRYRYAYSAFGILNALLLLVVFKRIRRGNVAPGPNCRWMQLTLLCGFLPIFIALMQGQDSILMLVLFVICGQMLETRSDAKAGAILALALFKFQFVLPAAVLIGLRRSRFFAAFAATTFALAGISVCLVGISGAQSGLGMLLNMSTRLSGASQQAAYMVFPSAMANLRGFIETTLGGVLQHGSLQQLTAGLSIGMLVWCAFRIRGLANIVICAVLVSYHALPHDLSLLLIPISTLCARIAAGASFQPRRDLAFLTSLMCAPTILLFFGSRFFLYAIVLCAALIFFPRSFEQETRVEGPSAVAAG
ncbi:MAG TPA: glycosyltransferase 87 family protein, partial [Candidatus Acidoferrales bacterium]|nr:glycosyltransferase 87 family protein [Candidatus Acidoferrales bacterium]